MHSLDAVRPGLSCYFAGEHLEVHLAVNLLATRYKSRRPSLARMVSMEVASQHGPIRIMCRDQKQVGCTHAHDFRAQHASYGDFLNEKSIGWRALLVSQAAHCIEELNHCIPLLIRPDVVF